jgi:hypothetical protein
MYLFPEINGRGPSTRNNTETLNLSVEYRVAIEKGIDINNLYIDQLMYMDIRVHTSLILRSYICHLASGEPGKRLLDSRFSKF